MTNEIMAPLCSHNSIFSEFSMIFIFHVNGIFRHKKKKSGFDSKSSSKRCLKSYKKKYWYSLLIKSMLSSFAWLLNFLWGLKTTYGMRLIAQIIKSRLPISNSVLVYCFHIGKYIRKNHFVSPQVRVKSRGSLSPP